MSEFKMRAPCKYGCDETYGTIETKNGQDMVSCLKCSRFQYNAPKAETGREQRSVSTGRKDIRPARRARILERDNCRCALCGNKHNLHVGHLLSVVEGLRQGLTDAEINDDENLATMCEECNLGLSDRPVPLRLMLAILKARLTFTEANA
jgi:5-methylcytosine-specific restriction endonuclease McrA